MSGRHPAFRCPRTAALVLTCCLAAACAGGNDRSAVVDVRRPSMLVVLVDALRPDHLGSYGYSRPTSPRLDELARRSIRFTRAYSVSSWTKPTIPSLFTSLYPTQHGVFEGNAHVRGGRLESDVLPDAAWTLAEGLRSCGYRTGAFVDNAHLRSEFGFGQGFDRYERRSEKAPELIARLLGWIDQAPRDPSSPFFAYLHLLDAHWPYEPTSASSELMGVDSADAGADRVLRDAVNAGTRSLSEVEIEQIVRSYDATIRDVDTAIGLLLAGLDERGLLEDLVIVVTADHGEEFLEHAYLGHGSGLYEPSLRVPLLLHLPRQDGARNVDRHVSLLDVMPTLLEIGSCESERRGLQGRSLLDDRGGDTQLFAEVQHGSSRSEALWDGRWKVIRKTHDPRREAPPALIRGRFEEPRELVGARLEIEGGRLDDGRFRVDEVEFKWPGDDDDEIRARIDAVDTGRRQIRLGGFTVDVERARLVDRERRSIELDALSVGDSVKVDGSASQPYRLEADKLRLEKQRPDVRIEGLIRGASADAGQVELEIVGLRVSLPAERLNRALRAFVEKHEQDEVDSAQTVYELYDLENDPRETRDLADRESQRLATLVQALDAHLAAISGDSLGGVARVELDSGTAAELRGLGYVQ